MFPSPLETSLTLHLRQGKGQMSPKGQVRIRVEISQATPGPPDTARKGKESHTRKSSCQPVRPVWPQSPPLAPTAWTALPQGQQMNRPAGSVPSQNSRGTLSPQKKQVRSLWLQTTHADLFTVRLHKQREDFSAVLERWALPGGSLPASEQPYSKGSASFSQGWEPLGAPWLLFR